MRTIPEQELKDILDKHRKWLRSEPGGEKADLRGADLSGANLYEADLSGADLSGANLYEADLSGADLGGANLYGADLRGADLRGANLRGADLSGANLYEADLSGADLRGADLRETGLLTFQFQQHQAYFTPDGTLQIGCIQMPISEWVLGYREIGEVSRYSKTEITEYGKFIKKCVKKFMEA